MSLGEDVHCLGVLRNFGVSCRHFVSSDSESATRSIDKARARFRDHFLSRAGFAQDKAAASDLEAELVPVLEALADASPGAALNAASLEAREALAMTNLFGRRVASRAVTPSAAFVALDAFLLAVRECCDASDQELLRTLSAVYFEGHSAAREEFLLAKERSDSAASQPILVLQKGCVALVLSGHHEPDALAEIVDRFARALLRLDARACVVDVTHLALPTSARAAEVFAADASARMLGVTCFISGVDDAWREAAQKARVPIEVMRVEPTFDSAVRSALQASGYRLDESGGLLTRILNRVGGRRTG